MILATLVSTISLFHFNPLDIFDFTVVQLIGDKKIIDNTNIAVNELDGPNFHIMVVEATNWKLQCEMDFTYFPLDSQVITLNYFDDMFSCFWSLAS